MNPNGADLGTEAMAAMAKHGIGYARVSQFLYGDYRYTTLEDAVAEAQRHPQAR